MLNELSEREMDVLELLVLGYSNSQIAKTLCITIFTVKAHIQAILKKLNVKNRIQAATIAAYFLEIQPDDVIKIASRTKEG